MSGCTICCMNLSQALTAVSEYTADQWGMITAAQATAAGIDSVTLYRLTDVGHLEQVRRGVYAVPAAPASRHREIQATWLALHPGTAAWQRSKLDPDGGVVSHRSAALVHEIGDMVIDRIELTVPRRRATRLPDVKLRQRNLDEDDITLVDGLPVTTMERTIEDLLDDHVDASHVAAAIKDAVQQHQLDLAHLAARIGRYCRRYGVKSQDGDRLLDHLLDQIGTSRDRIMRAPATPSALNASSGRTLARASGHQSRVRRVRETQRHNAKTFRHYYEAATTPTRRQVERLLLEGLRIPGTDDQDEDAD